MQRTSPLRNTHERIGQDDMHFLNGTRGRAVRDDTVIGESLGGATFPPAKYDTRHSHGPVLLKRPENSRRIPRRCNPEKYVILGQFACQLSGEHLLKPIIVANCSENGAIHRQGLSRQRSPTAREFTHKLCRQVLCVSCRPAIARNIDATTALVSINNGCHRFGK